MIAGTFAGEMNKKDIQTRDDIDFLVAEFYNKLMIDQEIGYIFTEVAAIDLTHHLPVISNFWESVLLGNPVYQGNPMQKHMELHQKSPLTEAHFNRWLIIWHQTLDELFEGSICSKAHQLAESVAGMMMSKIKYHTNHSYGNTKNSN